MVRKGLTKLLVLAPAAAMGLPQNAQADNWQGMTPAEYGIKNMMERPTYLNDLSKSFAGERSGSYALGLKARNDMSWDMNFGLGDFNGYETRIIPLGTLSFDKANGYQLTSSGIEIRGDGLYANGEEANTSGALGQIALGLVAVVGAGLALDDGDESEPQRQLDTPQSF